MRRGSTRTFRAAATAVVLSMAMAGAATVSAGSVASAQGVVTTQGYTIGPGPVSGATAVAQPDAAGATADYTVAFTTPMALAKGATITLTDPKATTVFPAAKADYIVIDNSRPSADQQAASVTLSADGHNVTLGLSVAVPAGDALSIYVVGATNPTSPGDYSLDVSTSANQTPASTASYQILGPAAPPAFAPTAAPPLVSGASTYTFGAFKAEAAIAAGGSLAVESFAAPGATDDVAFPAEAGAYKVTDLTTGAASNVVAVSVGKVASPDTGESATLKLASAIALGDELSVAVSGVHNPSATQTVMLGAAAPSTAKGVTAPVLIGTSVVDPTISLSEAGAGATAVEYTIGFRASSALPAGGMVTLTAPAGTSFAGGKVTVVDITHAGASANVVSSSVKASAVASSSSDNRLSFSVPKAVTAGDSLLVEVEGAANPAAGTYGGTAGNFTVSTASDVIAVLVPSYVITAAAAPVLASIELSTTAPGGTAQYSIGDLKATAALVAGSSTIELKAPSGTRFPGDVVDYTVTDVTHATSAHLASVSGGGTNDVVLKLGASVAGGDFIALAASNVVNPGAGSYDLSVDGALVGAVPPVAPPPPAAVAVSVSASPNPAVVGQAVTFTAKTSVPLSAGSVSFTSNGVVLADCRQVQLKAGTAACTLNYGAAGHQLVRAKYSGSAGYASASSAAYAEVVAAPPAPPKQAVISLSASRNPVLVGRPVTYTARIVPALSAGSISFTSGSTFVGNCDAVPVRDGQATCTVSYASPAQHAVTAEYLGTLGYTSSTSTAYTETVSATTETSVSATANPVSIGRSVTYVARVAPAANVGTVKFSQDGAEIPSCGAVRVSAGRAMCTMTYWAGGRRMVSATYTAPGAVKSSTSATYGEMVSFPPTGYWLATGTGAVYGEGGASSLGGISTSASTGPVVDIARTPTGKGYWLVTRKGTVAGFGDAHDYGDLVTAKVNASDIVAIAPTHDGRGYWLIGRDGGMFTFGDAKFYGSVPGLGLHVSDIVGIVAQAHGGGYLLAGSDGGVFTFGSARFYGSLPGLHKHVKDIRAILPASSGMGYVLVGSDGGAFVFGGGVHFLGSLPGRGIKVDDIIGIALTPDNGGYFMARSNGSVFGFGDASPFPLPGALAHSGSVVAIAGT
jgi:Bacterial Ig-like domain (group 3)